MTRGTYHALIVDGAKEDNKRPRTRPRSLSGAGPNPPLPPKIGAHRRGGRHRTAIATAVALGLETEEAQAAQAPAPGSMERVRSHTRHRAAIAEARALWEGDSEDVRDVQFPNGLRRGQSVPSAERSFAGRPKRPQRSLERSTDKGWFA